MSATAVGSFSARIGDREFTDRRAFAEAAKTWRKRGLGREQLGSEVEFLFAGDVVRGQVWALAPEPGHSWVRGNDGATYKLGRRRPNPLSRGAQRFTSLGKSA